MFKKLRKNQKGFTLVEVIVVAVIVAILAAVAIPLYLGYVADSRVNQCENAAGAVASFCGACLNVSGVIAPTGAVAPGATISCTPPAPQTPTSMIVPAKITVTITPGAPNVVTAAHADGGASVNVYNY
jgi:prepilin-type N-terminal cleavage/methylation domain-containing protein